MAQTVSQELRRVSVAVCASQLERSMMGFISMLREDFSDVIESVKFVEIPYNGIDYFQFKEPVDVMILVHSINNRRFSITNVTDALYDRFLPMAKGVIGQDKIAVVVHDLPYPVSADDKGQRMTAFRYKQPLTFQCSKLALTCGKLDDGQRPEIDDDDLARLRGFLEGARYFPKSKSEERSHWWKWEWKWIIPIIITLYFLHTLYDR